MIRYDITDLQKLEKQLSKAGFEILKEQTNTDLVCAKIYKNGVKIGEVMGTLLDYYTYLHGFLDGLNGGK